MTSSPIPSTTRMCSFWAPRKWTTLPVLTNAITPKPSNLRKSVVLKSKEKTEYCLKKCRRCSWEKRIRGLWWGPPARRASRRSDLPSPSTGGLIPSSFWTRRRKPRGGCINRKSTTTMPSCSISYWRSKAITMWSSGNRTAASLNQPWTRAATRSTRTFSKSTT